MLAMSRWSRLCTTVLLTSTCVLAVSVPDLLQFRSHSLTKRSLPNFVNFGNNAAGQAQITQAFKDMAKMVNACLNAETTVFNQVYSHWFPDNNRATVISVLKAMVNPPSSDGTGSTSLTEITVDNKDPDNICEIFGTVAYTINSSPADSANDAIPLTMHFCQTATIDAYKLPALSDVTCGDLDKFLSVKMQTFGGYALVHELSHVAQISGAAIKPLNIPLPGQSLTCKNTEDFAYGPQSCQELLTNKATSDNAVANADNYGWFVTELYWTLQCTFAYDFPETNLMVPHAVCDESKQPCNIR